ncbi:hypothetical protein V6N12_003799 [Hibiscus sabdariffa]|uniref:Reverse transcriptase domain-containing protein n=1 Tax=Hibiscus sabdariffa TaxID=183260 RepID=A0ABR2CJK6_9ROSI
MAFPFLTFFFADDLILYAKADVGQARVIKDILEDFCEHSGHRVSAQKSQVYFSPNTDPDQRDAICATLGFSPTLTLGKYLGVPVIHQRMKAADFDFLLLKLRTKLNGWAAGSLSLAGRKLAFQLVSSIESMWVTALKQKYRMLTTCPLSIARQNCSPLWRALANIWDSFQDNTFWLVGDAIDVHLWNDTWVPSVDQAVVPHVLGVLPPSFDDARDRVA